MSMTTEYTPASLRAVEAEIGRDGVPCRLRFEPFGPPRVGKPGKGDNRILHATAYMAFRFRGEVRPTIWFEANGIRYVLADGGHFQIPEQRREFVDSAFDIGSLSDCGRLLGRESPDGDGYVPVGVDVEVSMPD